MSDCVCEYVNIYVSECGCLNVRVVDILFLFSTFLSYTLLIAAKEVNHP